MAVKPVYLYEAAENGKHIGYIFYCPGCECAHRVITVPGFQSGARWGFNGDMERPTFTPSIKVQFGPDGKNICHMFIKDGRLQFLTDCTHKYHGHTIPMVDMNTLCNPVDSQGS
jgi:hypothetical protein